MMGPIAIAVPLLDGPASALTRERTWASSRADSDVRGRQLGSVLGRVPKRRQLCRFALGADIQREALGFDFNIAKRCCTGPRERLNGLYSPVPPGDDLEFIPLPE